jgi:SAM-dependent methyltransferase
MSVDVPEPESASQTAHREPKAEFDQHAAGYDAGMDNWLKRLAGASAEDFAEVKADWLLRYLGLIGGEAGRSTRLLDFGCGKATFLKALRRMGYAGDLSGCDVSEGMIREALRTWDVGPRPQLCTQLPDRLPFDAQSFDIVVASAVFHHIPPAQRAIWYAELYRVARAGGRCIVFEHNPWNPITRWVVSRTAIDANAILLSQREAIAALRHAGFDETFANAIMIFPPRLGFLRPIERTLARLPIGGQYVAAGRRRG